MPQILPVIGAIGAIAGTASTIASLAKGKPKQQAQTGGIGLDTSLRGMDPLSSGDYNQVPQLTPLGQPPQMNLGNYAQQLQAPQTPDLYQVMNQFRG